MTNRPAKISSVSLDDVLSWRGARLDLSPGLNVVVGPSDSGKTNVYRAVRAVVENAPADRFVRIGSTAGSATITFDDGASVSLGKGKGKDSANTYTVGTADPSGGTRERVFQKVGADCPAEVASVLRLGPVDLSGAEADIHFASQRGPAFGVDVRPGDLARIIGSVCGLDAVYSALSEAERSRKSASIEDARADAAFRLQRAKYRAADSVLSADQAKSYADLLTELSARHDETTRAALFLEETAGELTSYVDGLAVRTSALEEATRSYDEAVVLRQSFLDGRRAVDRLAEISDELSAASLDIEEAEECLIAKVKSLADLEAKAHQLTKTKCPLCGRSGR